MRTNKNITQTERNAFDLFCQQHHILNDESPASIQNGKHIGGYIALWDVDITEETLKVALEKLSDRLTFIPAEQTEVAEILAHLDQSQRDVIASWLSRQHRLETEGPKGFSNVSVLCAWLLNCRYAVTGAGLDMALGNVQNTGKRKIFWKKLPKQSREYVQGRPNHAFGQVEEPKEGRSPGPARVRQRAHNHAYTPPENAAKKPAEAPDAWHQICKLHLKEWVTEGQRAKLEAEYNAGIATGKSWREIGAALGQIVKGWKRRR
jgi:hypothetical protein